MPVLCPKCAQGLPPEDVNVAKDVAFCRTCNEAFALSAQVGTYGPPLVAQPPDSKIVFTRDDERIAVIQPAQGFKGTGCFFTFFALFWNGITWIVFLGFVGSMFGVVQSNSPVAPWMAVFFIPHMTIGLVTALIAVYCIYGDVALAIDRTAVLMQRRLFGYTWARKMPFEAITDIRLTEAYKSNGRSVQGIGFHFEGKALNANDPHSAVKSFAKSRPMTFGSGLSQEEKDWLLGELHNFWREKK
jgi:hypothetical protein